MQKLCPVDLGRVETEAGRCNYYTEGGRVSRRDRISFLRMLAAVRKGQTWAWCTHPILVFERHSDGYILVRAI